MGLEAVGEEAFKPVAARQRRRERPVPLLKERAHVNDAYTCTCPLLLRTLSLYLSLSLSMSVCLSLSHWIPLSLARRVPVRVNGSCPASSLRPLVGTREGRVGCSETRRNKTRVHLARRRSIPSSPSIRTHHVVFSQGGVCHRSRFPHVVGPGSSLSSHMET